MWSSCESKGDVQEIKEGLGANRRHHRKLSANVTDLLEDDSKRLTDP